MTTIREIVEGPWRREWGSKPEMDPLSEPDALMEAQILDVWVEAMRAKVAVLFDMRMALQLREGNTGLLVAYQTTDVHWRVDESGDLSRMAWNVVGSEPEVCDGELILRLGCMPNAVLELQARSAAYYSLEIPGLDETPPEYGQPPPDWPEDDPLPAFTDAQLNQRLARWDSEVVPVHAVFLDERELDPDEIAPDEPEPISAPRQPGADPHGPAPGWWTRGRRRRPW